MDDSTGVIPVTVWLQKRYENELGESDIQETGLAEMCRTLSLGDFILVQGNISTYRERLQLLAHILRKYEVAGMHSETLLKEPMNDPNAEMFYLARSIYLKKQVYDLPFRLPPEWQGRSFELETRFSTLDSQTRACSFS